MNFRIRRISSSTATMAKPKKSNPQSIIQSALLTKMLQTAMIIASCTNTAILYPSLNVNLYLMKKMIAQRTRGMLSRYLVNYALGELRQMANRTAIELTCKWQKKYIHFRHLFYYQRYVHLVPISSMKPISTNTDNTTIADIVLELKSFHRMLLMISEVDQQVSGRKNQQKSPRQKEQILRQLRFYNLRAMSLTIRQSSTAPPTQHMAGEIKWPNLQEKSPGEQQLVVKEGIKNSQLQSSLYEKVNVLKIIEKRYNNCAKQRVREQ